MPIPENQINNFPFHADLTSLERQTGLDKLCVRGQNVSKCCSVIARKQPRCSTAIRFVLLIVGVKTQAGFIEPMLLLRTDNLPEGESWIYQLKLDGFRSIAFKTGKEVHLRSRNDKDFALKYPSVVKALAGLPDETVIDGEIVALDGSGRPSFSVLQN